VDVRVIAASNRPLDELARTGELHDHPDAAAQIGKAGHYERYLLMHHKAEHAFDH